MTPNNITDTTIQNAIEQHDDPAHDDAWTVEKVRNFIDAINADIFDYWSEHQDAIDDGAYQIVHEDQNVIVLADSGHFWNEQLNAVADPDLPDDSRTILRRILLTIHREEARNRCDYSWSASDPVVVFKPASFRQGEQQVLREIARRTKEEGSVARAVDQLATEVHDWSKSNWASLTDRNPSTVTRMTQPKDD